MIDRQYRCPVCGAPVEGEKCEYCGCVIYDFATISTEEPRYIRLVTINPFTDEKMLLQMKAIAVRPNVEIQYDDCYMSHGMSKFHSSQSCTVTVDFQAVAENDKLFTAIPFDKPYRESWRDDIYDN